MLSVPVAVTKAVSVKETPPSKLQTRRYTILFQSLRVGVGMSCLSAHFRDAEAFYSYSSPGTKQPLLDRLKALPNENERTSCIYRLVHCYFKNRDLLGHMPFRSSQCQLKKQAKFLYSKNCRKFFLQLFSKSRYCHLRPPPEAAVC